MKTKPYQASSFWVWLFFIGLVSACQVALGGSIYLWCINRHPEASFGEIAIAGAGTWVLLTLSGAIPIYFCDKAIEKQLQKEAEKPKDFVSILLRRHKEVNRG